MKSFHYFIIFVTISLFVFSCNSEFSDMGSNIQPEGDRITVKATTFQLTTDNLFIDGIHHRPDTDSLLLGTFFNQRYGTTHADILARFEAPFADSGFRFPEDANVDSAFLLLSYRTWFGSPNSAISIRAYEMNKRTLDFYEPYFTNANPWDFVSRDNQILVGDTVLSTGGGSQIIRIRLSDDFTNRLFDNSKDFSNEEDFFRRFGGLYITSRLGDATMLHLRTVSMSLFYHYETTIADTATVISNSINYVVNKVVINRFEHLDRDEIRKKLANNTAINHISTPANVYTQVNIPLRQMVKQMQDSIGNKRLAVNSAIVRVEAIDTNDDALFSIPVPNNMLLLPKSEMDNFFRQERLPNDSIVFASFNRADSTYTFNVASYIDREIRRVRQGNATDGYALNFDNLADTMKMVLVPVRITTTASGFGGTTISSVRQQILMNGATIRSGNDPERPMTISLLYSGF